MQVINFYDMEIFLTTHERLYVFADGTVWKKESNSRGTDSKYIIFEAENHHVMLSTILIVKNRFKKYKK